MPTTCTPGNEAGRGPAEHCRRLDMIMNRTTHMVVVTDSDRRITWVNRAYTRVTGWTLDEVWGRTPRSFLHGPATSTGEAARIGSLLRKGQPVHEAEVLNYRKSGEPYWVSLHIDPVLDEAGQVREYISVQIDITARKRREDEAQRLLRSLREAQRLARLGHMEHDLGSGAIRCSEEIFRILDACEGEVTTDYEHLMACTHPDDRPEVQRCYEQAINSGQPFVSEHRVVSTSGEVKWVHMRGELQGWDDGGPAICRMAVQDITARKRAEQMVRDMTVNDRVARTQMETLARVGHEIRTPLHAILGFTDMLERAERTTLQAASLRQLGHIRSSAMHLLAVANDMMDMSALHEGRLTLNMASVDVAQAAVLAVDMLQALAQGRSVRLGLAPRTLAPGEIAPPCVWADGQWLGQVLVNLVGNAIKYNRPGGQVVVGWTADERIVQLWVRDDGVGISAEDQQRLFAPFVRAGDSRDIQRRADSHGLGLAIAKQVVQAMGGDLTVASTPGKGATFTVVLRRAASGPAAEAVEARAPGAPAEPGRARGRLLYVEDHEVNRLLVEGYLAARPGVELTCCGTGVEALAQARQSAPDLFLIDLQLPDMSGHEVLQAILEDPWLRRVPCVAFSADTSAQTQEQAIRSGFREYLAKPISMPDFLATMDRLLGDHDT